MNKTIIILAAAGMLHLGAYAQQSKGETGFPHARIMQGDRPEMLPDSTFYRLALPLYSDISSDAMRISETETQQIAERLHSELRTGNWHLEAVEIRGTASPDGDTPGNERLAERRAASAARMIRPYTGERIVIYRRNGRENTALLLNLMRQAHDHDLTAVEDIIRDADGSGEWKRRLQTVMGGRLWRRLIGDHFPKMRGAYILFWISRNEPVMTEETLSSSADTLRAVSLPEAGPEEVPLPEKAKTRRAATVRVGTNLLTDLLLIPSAGAELYLGNSWSIAAGWHYAWWSRTARNRFHQTYGGYTALRRWLSHGKYRMTGHHIGLYAQALTYDFEHGGRGQQARDWNGGAGVEYGYSLPLGGRLTLDFLIGVGYLGGTYCEYVPLDGHFVQISEKRRHWTGPTNAAVSLAWTIGRKGGTK